MTDTKHTPGPWDRALEKNWVWIAPESWKTRVCRVVLYEGEEDEQIANAHLIAAAPDMLEALKACEGFCDENGMVNGVNVRAAIAKAEGRDE